MSVTTVYFGGSKSKCGGFNFKKSAGFVKNNVLEL